MTSRREFLRDIVAGLGTGALLASSADLRAQAATAPVSAIIDPHVHVWDLKQFRLAWLDNAGPVLKRDFSPADYRAAVAGLNVARAQYVEVSVAATQREAEAKFAIDLCAEQNSLFGGAVIGGIPGTDGFRDYIAKFKNTRVRGVRCSYPRGQSRNAPFLDDLRFLGDQGLTFDLLMDASLLPEAVDIATACKRTHFILDHCGNASPAWFAPDANDAGKARAQSWREAVKRLGARENVACKISGVAEAGPADRVSQEWLAPVVNHCLDSFDMSQVMYASNWPVCLKSITIANWVDLLQKITAPRGDDFRRNLFSENARAWYSMT